MENYSNHKPILGVIGGMGPFASAQFVLTIYNRSRALTEQSMPEVHLFSRPGIADRSRSLKDGTFNDFTVSLIELLQTASTICDKLVICCFTSHNAWNDIPEDIRYKMINLVDHTLDMVRKQDENILLVATEGSYRGGIFLRNKPANLVLLKGLDIQDVHALIYDKLKRGKDYEEVYHKLKEYMRQYGCTRILAGCTELHLLKTSIPGEDVILDPLYDIAGRVNELMAVKAAQTI